MTVSSTRNKSEIDTLPEPELNPVMNPLLAAHMGRWAEVYFTTLPEKRGQAVTELLRELQNGSFPESAPFQDVDREANEKEVEPEQAPDAPPQASEAAPISAERWSESKPFIYANFPEYAVEGSSPRCDREGYGDREVAWTLPARNLPHLDVGPDVESEVERKPVPHRYSIYVAVALVILLAFLLYMAWRSTKASSRVVGTQSALSMTTPDAKPADPPVLAKNKMRATSRKQRPAATHNTSGVATTTKSHSVIGAEQSGVNEFVTAERYLKGTLGTTPDSRVAALWLWKAVSKKNPAAMIALSDLYLRGDGVPKSCDQARMLLDAAARKGESGAAERLRHLQAFGCD
jgi:hypothetical protein